MKVVFRYYYCLKMKLLVLLTTSFGFFPVLIKIAASEDRTKFDVEDIIFNSISQPHSLGLVAQIVPLVINPSENMDPPAFAAAVFKENTLAGAGAIISKHYVLTLCTLLRNSAGKEESASNIKVEYPVFDNTTKNLLSIKNVTASTITTHPECGDKTINVAKDIGLIHTKEPMDYVKYPKLPPHPTIQDDNIKYMISNYRVLNHAATDLPTAIWYIFTKPVDNDICEVLFTADKAQFSRKDNLCMSYFHLGDASYCKGDFGSPLSIRYKNNDLLVGLNLHKHQCGQPREAASFVSVKANEEWIKKHMKR